MQQKFNNLIGRRVKSLKWDCDCDEHDNLRPIPIGSMGSIDRLNHIDLHGLNNFDVAWDNGSWTVYSEQEVMSSLELVID